MKKIILTLWILVLGACASLFKEFYQVDDDSSKWNKEVSQILTPIQGKYLSPTYGENFEVTFVENGFSIHGNKLTSFRDNEEIRIKKIRHERTFTDYLGNIVEIYFFFDVKGTEYQLYTFPSGRLEIITWDRWDIFVRP